jgi:hypothetical protein
MSTRHITILISLILFLNLFFLQPFGSLGDALLLLGGLVFTILYFLPTAMRHQKTVAITGASILLLCVTLVLRDNGSTRAVLAVAALGTLASLFYFLVNDLDSFRAVSEFLLLAPRTAWRYIKSVIPGIKSLGKNDDTAKVSERLHGLPLKSLLMGIVISLPVLLVLVQLLSGADPIFKQTVENTVSADRLDSIIKHIVLSLIVFVGLLPLLNITYKPFLSPLRFLRSRSYSTEYAVMMTMVAAVLMTFVIVQWQYIFMPSVKGVDLTQFGFQTYSAYVQKGFNEFIAVSLFVFSLLWIGLVTLNKPGKKSYLLGVQLVVLAEFAIILAAFFRRIWLYQSYHGMTLVRFYGGYFVAVIGLLALTLLGRHLWNKRWIVIESLVLIAAVIGLGLFNIEAYIAQHPPTVNERVDYTYLSRLSADGYDGWLKAYDWSTQVHTDLVNKDASYSAEDRRQLAYAGVATERLLNHYDTLVLRYGSVEEQQHYYDLVIDQAVARIDERMAELDRLIRELPVGRTNPDGSPYVSVDLVSAYNSNKNRLETLRKDLVTAKENYHKDRIEQKHEVVLMERNGYWGVSLTYGETERCSQLIDCSNPQYTLDSYIDSLPMSWYGLRHEITRSITPYDRFLQYNASEAKAYERMKHDMPIEKLLDLQKNYFTVYEKIMSSATTTDFSFDADISLDTPFLPPVGNGYYY